MCVVLVKFFFNLITYYFLLVYFPITKNHFFRVLFSFWPLRTLKSQFYIENIEKLISNTALKKSGSDLVNRFSITQVQVVDEKNISGNPFPKEAAFLTSFLFGTFFFRPLFINSTFGCSSCCSSCCCCSVSSPSSSKKLMR